MAEGARLESVYTLTAYRGFESLSLRQIQNNRPCGGFFVCEGESGFDEKPTGSTKRQDSRLAQRASAARRARAMDGPSVSLDRSQIQNNRPCGGFFVCEGESGFDEKPTGSTKRQDSRLAQRASAARRARAMDGPSVSLDRSQIQNNRPCGGFFVY